MTVAPAPTSSASWPWISEAPERVARADDVLANDRSPSSPLPSTCGVPRRGHPRRGAPSLTFFVVPTLTFRLLFGFLILRHHRRELVHVNVTDHPTAARTAHQLVESFPEETAPKYLLRDRDAIYGDEFVRRVKGPGDERDPHRPSRRPGRIPSLSPDRFDPTRVPESRPRPRRKPPAPHPGPLLPLLSPGSHTSRARQGCAGRQAHRAPGGGQDRGASPSWRPAPSLHPSGCVAQHPQSSVPLNGVTGPVSPARSRSSIPNPLGPYTAGAPRMLVALSQVRLAAVGRRSRMVTSEFDEVLAKHRIKYARRAGPRRSPDRSGRSALPGAG
jgi:hypothetical protein